MPKNIDEIMKDFFKQCYESNIKPSVTVPALVDGIISLVLTTAHNKESFRSAIAITLIELTRSGKAAYENYYELQAALSTQEFINKVMSEMGGR